MTEVLGVDDSSLWTGDAAATRGFDCFRSAVQGRRILVTGAGGSIGSALTKALAGLDPEELILLDAAESGLHRIGVDLDRLASAAPARLIVGNVSDADLLRSILGERPVQIVFHAAACKHVPLMELNPFSAASTNVLGTRVLVEAASAAGVEQCVLLSTDKAVDPASVMGATKRIAELIFLAGWGETRTKIVRLGNVLGSSGSVVPLFLEQIGRGGPVTVADRQATRFFLTVRETVNYLLQALDAGGRSALLIPALGEAHRIYDLARRLIKERAKAGTEVEITFTGLRPGDKLTERMTSSRESICAEEAESGLFRVETPALPRAELIARLEEIEAAIADRDLCGLLTAIQGTVPEYRRSELMETQLRKAAEMRSV